MKIWEHDLSFKEHTVLSLSMTEEPVLIKIRKQSSSMKQYVVYTVYIYIYIFICIALHCIAAVVPVVGESRDM